MLDLSPHQSSLLSLHSAIEHALVVHLATAGTAGSAIEEELDEQRGAAPILRVPDVISYSTLRPIVERSSGRRLGQDELARLVWLWGADAAAASEKRSNIGFEISRSVPSTSAPLSSHGKRSIHHFSEGQRRGSGVDYMLGLRIRTDDGDVDAVDSDDEETRPLSSNSSPQKHMPPRTPPMRNRIIHTPGSRNDPPSPSPSPRISQGSFLTRGPLTPDTSPLLGSMPRTPPSTFGTKFSASPQSLSTFGRRVREHSGGSEQSFIEAAAEKNDAARSSVAEAHARRGISLVVLWNNGTRRRKREVRKRLVACCARSEGDKNAPKTADAVGLAISIGGQNDGELPSTPRKRQRGAVEGEGGLLTPLNSREEGHEIGSKRIRCDPSMLLPAADVFGQNRSRDREIKQTTPCTPSGSEFGTVPKAILPGASSARSQSHHPVQSAPPSPSKPTRVEAARIAHRAIVAQTEAKLGRSLSLTERIRAKQDAAKQAQERAAGCATDLGDIEAGSGSTSASAVAAAARRRAALSRLQDVAESIFMLFVSTGDANGKTNTSASPVLAPSPFDDAERISTRAASSPSLSPIPLPEVLRAVCKSSRIPMSTGEAREAMARLARIAPGFIEVVAVGARHWVRLLGTVQSVALPEGRDEKASVKEEGFESPVGSQSFANANFQVGILGAVRECIRAEMDRVV